VQRNQSAASQLFIDIIDYIGEFGKLTAQDSVKTSKIRTLAVSVVTKAEEEV
jgi:hypothetical protein